MTSACGGGGNGAVGEIANPSMQDNREKMDTTTGEELPKQKEGKWYCGWVMMQGKRQGEPCGFPAKYVGSSLGPIFGKVPNCYFCKRHFLMLCAEKNRERFSEQDPKGFVNIKHHVNLNIKPSSAGAAKESNEELKSKQIKTEQKEKERNKTNLLEEHSYDADVVLHPDPLIEERRKSSPTNNIPFKKRSRETNSRPAVVTNDKLQPSSSSDESSSSSSDDSDEEELSRGNQRTGAFFPDWNPFGTIY